ncbi:bifunctional folylpolyglutamate synthase/dihydrofolate synthase [Limosilactobacillus reuteri]|uniref:bifunctional folylpolyglutamate synthase/dihydrofolate synthase n=1 Tax=Limosilactobacillus reuteri TaxID=1598 RepID=UPI001E3A2322|nr:cyanophycin synthetase [Limosilactobacillus reuteri]MCC4383512.1 bifunctional folylpolyglutamate synthase/dihydrofolate synthase [Limosilactobacillus reuteri]MCC4420405.1 bifunctional folylpolyglutamate synthase/dihydrofolate synthase [Limosilactobacillus reuteri]
MRTYEQINAGFNRQMLGGQRDRVKFLRRILTRLGNPDQRFKIIHIAGTNGKGSTGTMLEQGLQNAGYRVGYFSSPALVDDREQVKVNDHLISKKDFAMTYQKITEHLPADLSPDDITIFEWWTLIMLQYFADQKIDWAVIECGLGGRDDATNIISAPFISVITHIALDHTRILGPTIAKIAQAKAGIIKTGTKQVFLAPHQENDALTIIKEKAQQQRVGLTQADAQSIVDGKAILKVNHKIYKVPFNLLGTFQSENLGTVISVFNFLFQQGLVPSWQPLLSTLATVKIAGRMQKIADHPPIILDGAHNPDAAKQLTKTISKLPHNKVIMVLGFLADKNISQMVKIYQQMADEIIITTPDHPTRALNASVLKSALPQAIIADNPQKGLVMAKKIAEPNDLIVVTGSFYTIKDIEANLDEK